MNQQAKNRTVSADVVDVDVLSGVVTQLLDPTLLLDKDLHYIQHNRAFVGFMQIRPRVFDETLRSQTSPLDLLGGEQDAVLARKCLAENRPVQRFDAEIRCPNGETKVAALTFVPVLEGKALLCLLRDVTGEVRVQRRFQELLREQRARVETLEERERAVASDLEEARAFQESLMPPLPDSDFVRFAVAYAPAETVGGDLYDVCALDSERFRVMVADVTGHGVQAALRTTIVKTEYDRIKFFRSDPGQLLEEFNELIVSRYVGQLHFSACCFDIESRPEGGASLRYANAGLPPLLHLSGGKAVEIIEPKLGIGVVSGIPFAALDLTLNRTDRIYVCTDGVSERGASRGDRVGEDLALAVFARGQATVQEALQDLLGEIHNLPKDPVEDDITVVGLEITK